ncbi:hypothetical protein [Vallitalea okinawensis]|uniref:hypothetical protein n=1 Tax=Vallitalea okinawensis TaxID=2078660 RepID=UPI000CFCA00A|nr:hypothetical protein [Vallitalea okinawensis]
MKRIVALILLLSIFLTSCQVKEPLRSYSEAIERTEAVDQGQSFISIEVENTYREGKEIDFGDQLQFQIYSQYDFTDSKNEQLETHSYIDVGDLGMDFSFYLKGNDIFIKLPFDENYLIIHDNTMNQEVATMQDEEIFTIIFQPFMEKWLEVLQEENVVRGEKTIMTTEDGDVKATKYTIQLNEEQLQTLVTVLSSILKSNSELILSTVNNYAEFVLTEEEFIQLIDDLKSELLKSDMSITAMSYINADGFVIDTSIEYTVLYENAEMPLKSQVYTIRMEQWDIYNEQDFNFPELTDDNSLSMDEFQKETKCFIEER